MPKLISALAHPLQTDTSRLRWLPLLLTLLCYSALAIGIATPLGRALLLAQYGVFLIWQPLIKPGFRLTFSGGLGLLLVGLLCAALANVWLYTLWLSVLCALLSGQMLADRLLRLKLFHLGVLLHWLLLLLWVVPQLAQATVTVLDPLLRYGVPFTLVLLALWPLPAVSGNAVGDSDLFHILLTWLGLLVCVLGSLALRQLYALPYLEALSCMLLTLGAGLALLGWLWSPRGDFAGIGAALSAHLLRLGTPFERWSALLSQLAAQDISADALLNQASQALTTLPTITGGDWTHGPARGHFGEPAAHQTLLLAGELQLRLYSYRRVSTTLRVQYQLIAELLNQFYLAKQREAHQRQQAYIAAVHETGARLTHDIKNLLQSLHSLVVISQGNGDPARRNALLAAQLPEITRRLEASLTRLRTPESNGEPHFIAAPAWWAALIARYAGLDIDFSPYTGPPEQLIDASLCDTVADNLLGNAIEKRMREPGIRIACRLQADNAQWALRVADNGSPIAAPLLAQLLHAPVPSAHGFGLGLYQSAKLAAARGATLGLVANGGDGVVFCLTSAVGTSLLDAK